MHRGFYNTNQAVAVTLTVCCCVIFLIAGARLGGAEIYLIERFFNNQVLLHFDTEPNRTYVLQYTDSLTVTSTGVVARWSNLFTAPALPFPNHYVIVDSGTAPQRFYRLSVSP